MNSARGHSMKSQNIYKTPHFSLPLTISKKPKYKKGLLLTFHKILEKRKKKKNVMEEEKEEQKKKAPKLVEGKKL